MKLTTLICFLLFLTISAHAQEKDKYGRPPLVPGITELKIGDQVPDILIDNIINNDKRSIRTADYKDKLLVLDFWDIYCTTCIASMPKLDSLQRVFGDRIKLLSVTYQSEEMITKFFKTNRFLTEHQPPVYRASVVDDRVLKTCFPYKTNPHVVWIYKGKVIAITGYQYINSKNIQEVLDGKMVTWPLKNDSFDSTAPFMLLTDLWQNAAESPYYSYSVMTGISNDTDISLGGITFKQDTIRNITRLAFFNQDIPTIYQMLLGGIKPVVTTENVLKDPTKMPYIPQHPSRTLLEVNDLSRLRNINSDNQAVWNNKNVICYEMEKQGIVNKTILFKLAIKDINNRLKLNGRYEKHQVKCLVFVKTDKPITDTLVKGATIPEGKEAMTIPGLVMMNLDMTLKYPPAIDETGLRGDVALLMSPTDGTIAGLRKEMQRHGLDLIEAEREIEVLVISDAK